MNSFFNFCVNKISYSLNPEDFSFRLYKNKGADLFVVKVNVPSLNNTFLFLLYVKVKFAKTRVVLLYFSFISNKILDILRLISNKFKNESSIFNFLYIL